MKRCWLPCPRRPTSDSCWRPWAWQRTAATTRSSAKRLRLLGVAEPRFSPRRRNLPIDPAELAAAVASSDSWAMAARRLGLSGAAAERRVKQLAGDARLSTRHMLGQGWNRGVRLGGRPAEPLSTLLVSGRHINTTKLRQRLLRDHLLAPQCAACGRDTWEGAAIPLELDHLNGDRTDNRLANLRLLCPNCHARTPTYRGRNIGAPGTRSRAPQPRPTTVPDAERASRRLLAIFGGTA